jgi:hypothetical protein
VAWLELDGLCSTLLSFWHACTCCVAYDHRDRARYLQAIDSLPVWCSYTVLLCTGGLQLHPGSVQAPSQPLWIGINTGTLARMASIHGWSADAPGGTCARAFPDCQAHWLRLWPLPQPCCRASGSNQLLASVSLHGTCGNSAAHAAAWHHGQEGVLGRVVIMPYTTKQYAC